MLDQESTKKILELQEKLDKAESDLSLENIENATLNAQIAKLNKDISDKNDAIQSKNAEIQKITMEYKSKYTDNIVVKDLTERLSKVQSELATLQREKSAIEEERNSLKTELLEKNAKVVG